MVVDKGFVDNKAITELPANDNSPWLYSVVLHNAGVGYMEAYHWCVQQWGYPEESFANRHKPAVWNFFNLRNLESANTYQATFQFRSQQHYVEFALTWT